MRDLIVIGGLQVGNGSGKAHAGETVRLLIADDHVRVVRRDGSLLRELVLDVSRDYQPLLD